MRKTPIITLSALALGVVLAVPAFAQQGQTGNPASNAAASGGGGTHHDAQKTGSAANNEKVLKNQNGYRPQ